MIKSFRLLRNVGQFDSVAAGAALPLARVSVVYAENGRGKTTLAAVLRSLSSGDPIPITERHRLSAVHPPTVVLECSDGTEAVFGNNAWSRTLPNVSIFDDVFVDENVYSGLVVGAGHRQNLHELILGSQGVALTRLLQELTARIEAHNSELRTRSARIPESVRRAFTVDQFCALQAREDIDEALLTAERALAAAQEQDQVRAAATFESINLPSFDVESLEAVLCSDLPALDQEAVSQVETHLGSIGGNAEGWVADGMKRLEAEGPNHDPNSCPFCAQGLGGSPIIDSYRTYFSKAYTEHLAAIDKALSDVQRAHGGDVLAAFERAVRVAGERRQFWSKYAEVPGFNVDTATFAREWLVARDAVLGTLHAKKAAPLDRISLPEEVGSAVDAFDLQKRALETSNAALVAANPALEIVKEQVAAANVGVLRGDVDSLLAVKARFEPNNVARCDEHLSEKAAKTATEAERTQAKADLEQYRTNAFPGYQTAINVYLGHFNAGFRLDSVTPADTRGGPTCTYNVIINNTPVAVSASPTPGQPSFRNTLSAGDRNTLALAFFFASLDQDPSLGSKIVVIDDPLSSLDDHRSMTTVQQVRRLAERTEQVIVLSHTKTFLCRIWESADRTERASLQVARDGDGSTLAAWDVSADSVTEHDRRHALVRSYLANAAGTDHREVARAIRPIMEAFLRVAYPERFPPETLLGPFKNICDQRIGGPEEILTRVDTDELGDLIEYANRFHHDSNPAWEMEIINDGELRGFVTRTMQFTKR